MRRSGRTARATPVTRTTDKTPRRAAGGASRARRKRDEEVVAAAAKVFYERGYSAATVQDIADELGILKGSLYHYIKTKEDLLFRIFEEVHKEVEAILEEVARGRGAEPARAHRALRAPDRRAQPQRPDPDLDLLPRARPPQRGAPARRHRVAAAPRPLHARPDPRGPGSRAWRTTRSMPGCSPTASSRPSSGPTAGSTPARRTRRTASPRPAPRSSAAASRAASLP